MRELEFPLVPGHVEFSIYYSDEARWERFGDSEAFLASIHFDLA